jgi:RNA polymerase sigma factor (sigma-70 family)
MQQQPRRSPPATRRGVARLEPGYQATHELGREAARPVPRPWLREHQDAAAQLDRLLADAKLIDRLQWSGFAGAEYDRFAEELARYGVAVLRKWLYTGEIFGRLKDKGFGPVPPLPATGWDADDRDMLVNDTVVLALRKFREQVLLRHRWDPDRGATLKTFFIGQCLMRFPNFYRGWVRDTVDRESRHRLDELGPDDVDDRVDVERRAVVNDELARGLRQLDPRTRAVLVLRALGYQQDEIAERLGTTRKAVECIESRHRKRLERHREGDGHGRNEQAS